MQVRKICRARGGRPVQAERTPDLTDVLDIVERSLDRFDHRGDDLAAAAHLSRFHFDRIVGGALGEAPGAFRRRLLLERAAVELVRTAQPVIDVALRAGYGSPDAFTRSFTRAYGDTPSDDRPAHTGSGMNSMMRVPPWTRS